MPRKRMDFLIDNYECSDECSVVMEDSTSSESPLCVAIRDEVIKKVGLKVGKEGVNFWANFECLFFGWRGENNA